MNSEAIEICAKFDCLLKSGFILSKESVLSDDFKNNGMVVNVCDLQTNLACMIFGYIGTANTWTNL